MQFLTSTTHICDGHHIHPNNLHRTVAIAVFGFFVWEHHMFIMGVGQYSALVFSLLTMLVAVPSAIKVFNWVSTLYKGSITFEAPMVYAFCFLGFFVIGGCTGVFLGSLGMDV